jgi:aminodeoxyfutalosine deaminase
MIIRARTLLTMAGPPIENGAVCVRGGRIAAVGAWPEISAAWSGEVLDLGEQVLLPGLINAHCHLDYTALRGVIPPQESFTAWIKTINAEKAKLTPGDYLQAINDGFREAAEFGTTTLLNLEAFPELVRHFANNEEAVNTCWFAEMIDVRGSVTFPDDLPLAPHAPFTASAELYQRAAQQQLATTHLAESREELQMFRDAAGPLYEFMRSIGRNMDDCGGATPLQLVAPFLNDRWIVAHLNELTAEDHHLLNRAVRFHIVHCPRSHAYFGHTPFAMRQLRQLGFNICVGTDSLASNSSLSLLAELRQAQHVFSFLTADELLQMVTVNAATALHQRGEIGQVQVNARADMIALPFSGTIDHACDAVIAHTEKVPWRMLAGRTISSS